MFDRVDACDNLVVIAAHKNLTQFASLRGHLVRTCAVANDVAQIHDEIGRRRDFKAGLQGLKIAVDVAEQKYAQKSPRSANITCSRTGMGIICVAGLTIYTAELITGHRAQWRGATSNSGGNA